MADIERQEGGDGQIPAEIEITARFLLGQIKREDLSAGGRAMLDLYLGLLEEDSEFKDIVNNRKNEIILADNDGRKIPLFTREELASAEKHKKRKKLLC